MSKGSATALLRPKPLKTAPIGLLRDEIWQMSFGDRAALVGLLADARPTTSIEIGSADGGSLRWVAAYSGHVHSFDVVPLPGPPPDNVTHHVGDSKVTVPALLEELERSGSTVDFALVDGDHSSDGVEQDVTNLLTSSVTVRTLIVLHDTMNAEVREGIDRVAFDRHPAVGYYEPHLVPGFRYREGPLRGKFWGGFGVIVTSTERFDGYDASGRQSLYEDARDLLVTTPDARKKELRQLERLERTEERLAKAERRAHKAEARTAAMETSRWWRSRMHVARVFRMPGRLARRNRLRVNR